MENIDFEKIRKNTSFLINHFFDEKIHISIDMYSIHFEEIEALKKSIEILKSSEYSKALFKKQILSVSAPTFWNDLYSLEYYRKGKESIINSIRKDQIKFENDPDKEDVLIKHNFETWAKDKLKKINQIDNIIILTNEFCNLLNKEFPNLELESEFAKLLHEHNELQIKEARIIEERDKQRAKDREEKQNTKPTPAPESTPKAFAGSKIIDIYDPIKVHKEFKKELKCDYNTFKAWFIDSVICDKQMSWDYGDGNKAQLIKFIFILCGGWEPAQINTVFKTKVDSNNNRAKELNANLLQRLEKCTIK